jgi:hypothetical protein
MGFRKIKVLQGSTWGGGDRRVRERFRRRVEPEMPDEERVGLQNSAEILKAALDRVAGK